MEQQSEPTAKPKETALIEFTKEEGLALFNLITIAKSAQAQAADYMSAKINNAFYSTEEPTTPKE